MLGGTAAMEGGVDRGAGGEAAVTQVKRKESRTEGPAGETGKEGRGPKICSRFLRRLWVPTRSRKSAPSTLDSAPCSGRLPRMCRLLEKKENVQM